MSQSIGMGDLMNETEQMISDEMRMIVKQMISVKKASEPEFDYEAIMQHPSTQIDPSEPTILFLGTVSMKPT